MLLENCSVKVLFNLDANHSFIFIGLVKRLEKHNLELKQMIVVATLVGDVMIVTHEIGNSEIRMHDKPTIVNVILLNIGDYDVILWMD